MRQTPIKIVSDKQRIELALRRKLKYELYLEQEGKCAKCGKFLNWYNPASDSYPHLSHEKPLSAGGKTTKENCTVKCAECHSNGNHNQGNVYNSQPQWGR